MPKHHHRDLVIFTDTKAELPSIAEVDESNLTSAGSPAHYEQTSRYRPTAAQDQQPAPNDTKATDFARCVIL